MKPEEPQEEQEKDLPGWAYKIPFFLSKYGTHLLFAVAIVLLAYNLKVWYENRQATQLNNAWSELADSGSSQASDPPARLNDLISRYDIKPVQAFAYVALGDFYADTILVGNPPEGVRGVKVTREVAQQEAQTAYNKVISDYADQPLAVARARLGLGKIYEDLGQWDKAREIYQAIAAQTSGTNADFAQLAKARLDHLDQWKIPIVVGAPTRVDTAPAPTTTTAAPTIGPIITAATRPAIAPTTKP